MADSTSVSPPQQLQQQQQRPQQQQGGPQRRLQQQQESPQQHRQQQHRPQQQQRQPQHQHHQQQPSPQQQRQQQQNRQPNQQQQRPQKEKTTLIIGDSNSTWLEPRLLKRNNNVVIEERFTLQTAKNDIPQLPSPDDVADVVMLTGINNIKHSSANIPETIDLVDATCKAYSEKFPNARIHVGSVAPSCEKHIAFNSELKRLAAKRKALFIPVDAMMDRVTGQLRPKMLSGYHYTPAGLKTFAKEIKRSLYDDTASNRNAQQSNNLNSHQNHAMPIGSNVQGQPKKNARQEIQSFIDMAISRLGNL